MAHGIQNLPVTTGYQTYPTKDLQDRDLGLDVFTAHTLCDDVDGRGVGQHIGSAML